jgi:hydroxymethylpyrimidine pyrophosphatase-like HAD family hydrolase
MAYQPMLELLAYLRANGFKTFIVSGGGVEFMRAFAEKVYDIPSEQVIGSSGKQKFELRAGKPVLIKLPAVDFIDDKEGKPIAIQKHIGRRPIAAFGNSDDDLQMLQWTAAGAGPIFASTFITPMQSVSLPTTATRTLADSTKASTKLWCAAGQLSA